MNKILSSESNNVGGLRFIKSEMSSILVPEHKIILPNSKIILPNECDSMIFRKQERSSILLWIILFISPQI